MQHAFPHYPLIHCSFLDLCIWRQQGQLHVPLCISVFWNLIRRWKRDEKYCGKKKFWLTITKKCKWKNYFFLSCHSNSTHFLKLGGISMNKQLHFLFIIWIPQVCDNTVRWPLHIYLLWSDNNAYIMPHVT